MNKELVKKALKNELCRRLFWEFCLHMDKNFFERRPFLKKVADAFQFIADGKIKSVAISMPPRAGKSYITSLFCAWWLGKNPELCVMRNTVTSSLYRKFSYDVRAILKEPSFAEVFPKAELADDKQNVDGWALVSSKQGAYFGNGVGGNIIGFGANLAITDDLYSSIEQALSENYNERVFRWKQGSHDSRKERGCPEIYIGTRWSKQDVIGKAEVDERVVISALDENGKSFCEDVKTTEEYEKIKSDIENLIWLAEYMQDPIEAEGLLFPIDQLRFGRMPQTGERVSFAFMDPANKGGDYFASIIGYLVGKDFYVEKVFCNQLGSDVNSDLLAGEIINRRVQFAEYEGVFHWMEEGKILRTKIQEVLDDCDFRIVSPTTNKQTRILVQSAFIKKYFVFREDWEKDKEYKKFIQMMTVYLKDQSGLNTAKHDDAPDVCAMAAAHLVKKFSHLY